MLYGSVCHFKDVELVDDNNGMRQDGINGFFVRSPHIHSGVFDLFGLLKTVKRTDDGLLLSATHQVNQGVFALVPLGKYW